MTRRGSPVHRAALALVAVGLFASPVAAQSLGDLAKKTAAERETAKTTTPSDEDGKVAKDAKPASKTYTEDDLKKLAPSTPGITTAPPAAEETKTDGDKKPSVASSTNATVDAAKTDEADPRHDEAYWKTRLKPLWTRLDADRIDVTEAIRRVDMYQAGADSSRRMVDGTVYVDRSMQERLLAAIDEMNRLTALVKTDNMQIADIEEEARRAGVLPGWVRR